MATDSLLQFLATIRRIDPQGPRPGREEAFYSDVANALDADEAWACARQQQLWLASFPADDCVLFIDKLCEYLTYYRVGNPPTLQSIYKAVPDAGGRGGALDEEDDDLEGGDRFDCSGWVDKGADDIMREHLPTEREPMELFLFKTCALILYNMKNQAGADRASPAAVSFFFESIETGSTHYVQRAAAHCAGILSHAHLPFLLERYAERLKAVPEKKFRWLLYQQATQLFAFGVTTQEQAEATVVYLEATAKKMAKIDRGKLRGAFCTSLYCIFGSIMGKEAEAQTYWGNFTRSFHVLAKRYSDAFASIYHTVAKWAKKAKHALPCWCVTPRAQPLGRLPPPAPPLNLRSTRPPTHKIP